MQDPGALSWTTVVSRGASKRVITPRFQNKQKIGNDGDIKLVSKVIYEDEDLKDQLVARKATALVQQALTPGSVLFSFPGSLFKHRTDAYDEIIKQCGETVGDGGLRCISEYGQRTSGDLMVEALFASAEGTHKSLFSGVEIGDVTYKASLSHDKLVGDSIVHVQLNILRMCDEATFVSELTRSLRYYGRVIQMKKFTCRGYFEGQISVILDTSVGYLNSDGDMVPCEDLTRMLYLREWDVYAPASFKGAAPVCHFCRQSGHVRKNCPDLAKRKCFNCRGFGHTARFCKVRNEQTDAELIEDYLELSSGTGDEVQDKANGEKDDAEMSLAREEKDFNANPTGTAASKFASSDVAITMDTRESRYESEVNASGASGSSGSGVSGVPGAVGAVVPGVPGVVGAGVPGVLGVASAVIPSVSGAGVPGVAASGSKGGNGASRSSGSAKNNGKSSLPKPNDHLSKAKHYINENKNGFTVKNSSYGSARRA
jgi:hypothetical protein